MKERTATWLLAVVALCACSSRKSSPPPTADANPFANSFDGALALRDTGGQLTGDFADLRMTVTGNSEVQGTVSVGVEGSLAAMTGEHADEGYQEPLPPEAAIRFRSVAFSGTANASDGTFRATGTGTDTSGAAVALTIDGSFLQLGANQVANSTVNITVGGVQSRGRGQLAGRNAVNPPGNVIALPTLTPPLRIPQGTTVRFRPTGSARVANPDEAETGDVVNFSIPGFRAPGFDGFSNIDSGDWAFSFDGTLFTLSVPVDAPLSDDYTLRDRSRGVAVSADFEVIECPLQQYTGTNITGNGEPIWVDELFLPTMATIDQAAGQARVTVLVTDSFRVAGRVPQGVVVPPATRSNHLVGHAIDMNVQYRDANNRLVLCNSSCLGATPPAAVADFLQRCQAAGVRWGGTFNPVDVVHFDDAYNGSAPAWDERYALLQQCAQHLDL